MPAAQHSCPASQSADLRPDHHVQDIGGCGQRGPVDHHLGSQPRVFTLQLGWESRGEAPEAIAATLAAVGEAVRWMRRRGCAARMRCPCLLPARRAARQGVRSKLLAALTTSHASPPLPPGVGRPQIDLGEVYQGTEPARLPARLRSMVCYRGQHYVALVLLPEAGGWLLFDDSRVTRVGAWADVRAACQRQRFQPSLLFYEAAAAAGPAH